MNSDMIPTILYGASKSMTVGPGHPTRVMALLGEGLGTTIEKQLAKLSALSAMLRPPDVIGDLSIAPHASGQLWREILASGQLTATLPIYRCERRANLIDPLELLDIATEHMQSGVSIITIHPTPTRDLIDLSRNRLVPWTSRGGGIVIRDLLERHNSENAYSKILPEIIAIAQKSKTTISLGASFRSANIFDSFDTAQKTEITAQLELARHIASSGVGVIIEAPGHARPSDLKRLADLLRPSPYPIMPLGPMPTDAAIGHDHVAGAIGATLFGLQGCGNILTAVTSEEHTGGVPSLESTVEAVAATRIAAHVIDLELLADAQEDFEIAQERSINRTCVVGKQSRACNRCGSACPL